MAKYRGFESLERRRLLTTVASDYGGDSGFNYDGKVSIDWYLPIAQRTPIIVNGTSKSDRIIVYATDEFTIDVSVNKVLSTYDLAKPLVIDAGTGDDIISVELQDAQFSGNITVRGGEGNDSIFGGAASERIFAGAGNDVVTGGGGRDSIYGEDGDDSLRGDGGSDLIDGGAGYDTLRGDAGNDNLAGGDNPDRLRGGLGNDQLSGGGGRDILAGEDGDDTLTGDNGADSLYPGAGNNILDARSDDYVDDGGVIKAGAGTLTLTGSSTYTGGVTISGGTLKVSNNQLVAGSGSGKLNLSDNKLIVANPVGSWNGSSYSGVTGLIATGRNSGSWNGSGIVTSQTSAAGGNFTTIGVANATDVIPPTTQATGLWDGQTITGTDTLVMYTYGGDATLDGKLNIDDYVKIDSGIAANLTGWSNGDFNYDGKVNIDDYTTFIDANIGSQGTTFPTSGGSGVAAVTATPIEISGTAKADRILVYNDEGGSGIAVSINRHVTHFNTGPVIIDAGEGDDIVSVELSGNLAATFVTIRGGAGNDTLYSGDTPDRIEAGDGDDLVNAGGGRNIVYGGAGNDSLTGGNSTDHLDGEAGTDTLVGLRGENFLSNGEA